MILFHVTHKSNAHLISVKGLSPARARGEHYIWLCTRSMLDHYRQHVADAHAWQVSDTVIFAVDVLRGSVRRYRRGVWRTSTDISPRGMTLYIPAEHPLMERAGVLGLRMKRRKADAANSRGYFLGEYRGKPRRHHD